MYQTEISLPQIQMRQLACPKSIKKCMNGIPMARHGPKLGQNEATASRNVFKYLPGPPEAISGLRIQTNMEFQQNRMRNVE